MKKENFYFKTGALFVTLIVSVILLSKCSLSRSTLIDHNIAVECKLLVEVAYLTQKSGPDKAFLVPMAQKCSEANTFIRCEKYIDDRLKWEACKGALK